MNQAPLGKLLRIDLRSVWKSDAFDFAPWVAENIGLIGESLGLDLEVVGHRPGLGESSVDVLAHDRARNRRVLIESRLEETDHAHLGQLITHAASLQAGVVVWVSRELRDEHRQAIAWLNRGDSGSTEYFGIVVELLQIDNSRPAPNLRVVATPARWTRGVRPIAAEAVTVSVAAPVQPAHEAAPAHTVRETAPAQPAHETAAAHPVHEAAPAQPAHEAAAPAPVPAAAAAAPAQPAPAAAATDPAAPASAPAEEANSRHTLYLRFFQRLLEDLHEVPGFASTRRAGPQSWYSFNAETRGFQYVASFDQCDRIWTELYIDLGERAQNVAAFEALRAEKHALEQAFGEALDWDYGQGRRACRIAASRQGKIEDSAASLDEYRCWAVDRLLRFHGAFGSHLPAAVAQAEEAVAEPPHKSPGRISIEMLLPKSFTGTGNA